MRALSLHSVSFGYDSARTVLEDISLDLGPGWHGLVGINGSGKSTLLALIGGEVRPTSGVVNAPGRVVLCPQRTDVPSPEVLDLARSHQAAAYVIRGRLDLDPETIDRWETLSPGERRRWQVAGALAAEPAVLLLDEPTNHLDQESSGLLIAELARFRGIGVVATHDRELLDRLTNSTVRVHGGGAVRWAAPYTVARQEWLRQEQALREQREAAANQLRTMRKRLDDEQRAATEKIAKWKREQRYARPGDHDTTSAARTRRYRAGQKSAGRRITAVRDETQRAAEHLASFSIERD
ncbi:MAG: ATP-binding cassette domain-containing protein, partial [Acidimicrobiia bacterium]|nr:ATP-binding cassette domain-containing protein [Acidimicrobiia bacterium]